MNSDILTMLVKVLVAVLSVLITSYVIPWIKGKIGAQKYETIQDYCELAVRSAEQLYTQEECEKKKNYVLSCVSAKLNSIGLELSELEINAIIEGMVQAVKKG